MADSDLTPEEQIKSLETQLAFLAGAALGVVTEMHRIHDLDEWPLKYRAPFGAIANLSKILDSLGFTEEISALRKMAYAMDMRSGEVVEQVVIHDSRYWMREASGVLRPAVEAYLRNEIMTADQIAAMRGYLRQWIEAPAWQGEHVEDLRNSVDGLTSRQAIRHWLILAAKDGIDPL